VCACKGREWGGVLSRDIGGCDASIDPYFPPPPTLETYTPQKPPAQWHRKGGAEYKGTGVGRGGGVTVTGVHIILSFIDSLYISMCVCARAHAVRDLRVEKGYPLTLHATKQTTTTKLNTNNNCCYLLVDVPVVNKTSKLLL